jgi:hypothetical protein
MTTDIRTALCVTVICGAVTLLTVGCSSEQASEVAQNAEENATEVAENVSEEVGEAAEKMSETASEVAEKVSEKAGEAAEKAGELAAKVGEKAKAYLTPLQEKFDNLKDMKDKPAELKEAVSGLITSIEERAEDLELPQKISDALTAAKEKLIELRDYLEGEVEEAQIEERIQGIVSTVGEQLGMTE